MTHICVGKSTIIASDNGLSPGRRQDIIWTNAGILIIGPLGTKLNEILIEIDTFLFKKINLKMSSAKWRPLCLGPNVFIVLQEGVGIITGRAYPIAYSYMDEILGGCFVSIFFGKNDHTWLSEMVIITSDNGLLSFQETNGDFQGFFQKIHLKISSIFQFCLGINMFMPTSNSIHMISYPAVSKFLI